MKNFVEIHRLREREICRDKGEEHLRLWKFLRPKEISVEPCSLVFEEKSVCCDSRAKNPL